MFGRTTILSNWWVFYPLGLFFMGLWINSRGFRGLRPRWGSWQKHKVVWQLLRDCKPELLLTWMEQWHSLPPDPQWQIDFFCETHKELDRFHSSLLSGKKVKIEFFRPSKKNPAAAWNSVINHFLTYLIQYFTVVHAFLWKCFILHRNISFKITQLST